MLPTASESANMLSLQRFEADGKEQGHDDTLWDGLQLFEEAYMSGSIGDFLINKKTTENVPTARDEGLTTTNPDKKHSVTSQNQPQEPSLQEPVTPSRYPSQEIPTWNSRPSGSSQTGRQETNYQPRLPSPGSTTTELHEELVPPYSEAKKKHQEEPEALGHGSEHLIDGAVQKRDEIFNFNAVHSLAFGGLRSFSRRKLQPWPNPQQSLGDIIQTKNKKIKGKVWVAVGPAQELFETQIRPQIEKLLHKTEPPQYAPLLLTLYMIGKSEMKAYPIIMICCVDRKVRKDAEAIIQESDILQQFPQIGLGNSATILDTGSFVVPV